MCGVGSGGTITGLSRYFARVAPHVEMVLADPVGSVLADYIAHRQDRRGRLVGGRGHRRGLHSADRRSVARAARLHDHRRRKPDHGPRPAARARAFWPARRRARWWPPRCATAASRRRRRPSSRSSATRATSTCRRCSTTTGWTTRAFARASAFGDLRDLICAAVCRRRRGQRRAGRAADDRLRADAAVRRLATAGARAATDRRHPRRIGPAAGRQRDAAALSARRCAAYMTTTARDRRAATRRSSDLLPIFDAGRVAIVADEDGLLTA